MKEEFEEIQVVDFKKPKKTKAKDKEQNGTKSVQTDKAPQIVEEKSKKEKALDHEKRYAVLLKRAVELLNKNNPELGTPPVIQPKNQKLCWNLRSHSESGPKKQQLSTSQSSANSWTDTPNMSWISLSTSWEEKGRWVTRGSVLLLRFSH